TMPQSSGGPKREDPVRLVSGTGGGPSQPAASNDTRGRRQRTGPAASPVSRSRPTKGARGRPARRRPQAMIRHRQRPRPRRPHPQAPRPKAPRPQRPRPPGAGERPHPSEEKEKPASAPPAARHDEEVTDGHEGRPVAVPAPEPQIAGGEPQAAGQEGHE